MAHQGKRHACAQIERELESRIRLGHCVQGAEIQELGRTRLRRSPVRHSAGNGLSAEQLTPAVVACATDAFALAERFDAQCACRMLGKHAPPCGFVAACELDWLRFRHEGAPGWWCGSEVIVGVAGGERKNAAGLPVTQHIPAAGDQDLTGRFACLRCSVRRCSRRALAAAEMLPPCSSKVRSISSH